MLNKREKNEMGWGWPISSHSPYGAGLGQLGSFMWIYRADSFDNSIHNTYFSQI
jgi:hypothetical protein